ncbi:MAG: hypothetical protein HFJ60_01360 [Clostridia bacterium]|nr:hypothetical protein [Clostridia bacterium]
MKITTEYTFNSNVTISLSMLVNEVVGGRHWIDSIRAKKNNNEIIILKNYGFYAKHPVIMAEPSNGENALIIRIVERDENSHDYLVRIKVYDDIVYVSTGITVGAYPLEED